MMEGTVMPTHRTIGPFVEQVHFNEATPNNWHVYADLGYDTILYLCGDGTWRRDPVGNLRASFAKPSAAADAARLASELIR
jgi:hypothetical protein